MTDFGTLHSLSINGYILPIVNDSPFGNCQNFAIKHFNTLIDKVKKIENIKEVIHTIKERCIIYKPFLVVDIEEKYYEKIKDHLKFHLVSPYTNANNSEMIMCIIDTRNK